METGSRSTPSCRSTAVLERIVEAAARVTEAGYAALGVIDRQEPASSASSHTASMQGQEAIGDLPKAAAFSGADP